MQNWFSSLFNGGSAKQQYDPLAEVRQNLISLSNENRALSTQVPEQVAKLKELSAARYAQAKTEGQQNIAENIRADKGFGNTSLQDTLNAKLVNDLFKSQNESDLNADIWGTQQQSNILRSSANILNDTSTMYPPEQSPSWQSNLFGILGNIGGNWLGSGTNTQDLFNKIRDMFGNQGYKSPVDYSSSHSYNPNYQQDYNVQTNLPYQGDYNGTPTYTTLL